MILRRFMQHVREQNWFAVGLDVIVVIVGIFLGLQVQAAYEDRAERAREHLYLEQLHTELVSGIEITRMRIGYRDVTYQNLLDLAQVLKGDKSRDELGGLYCYALYTSHIYADQPAELATLIELAAAEKLSLIQNDEIRRLMLEYSLALDSFSKMVGDISVDRQLMHRAFPELIRVDPTMFEIEVSNEELLAFDNQCDLDGMLENTLFINSVADALGRLHYFMKLFGELYELQQQIHNAVDTELGILHAQES